jgi:hypothetical protein
MLTDEEDEFNEDEAEIPAGVIREFTIDDAEHEDAVGGLKTSAAKSS